MHEEDLDGCADDYGQDRREELLGPIADVEELGEYQRGGMRQTRRDRLRKTRSASEKDGLHERKRDPPRD